LLGVWSVSHLLLLIGAHWPNSRPSPTAG
jgi:hypothetical protein